MKDTLATPPAATTFLSPPDEVEVQKVEKVSDTSKHFYVEAGSSTFAALNRVTCDNIALTNSVKLGDALYHLALAIGRSGEEVDDMGNVSRKGVNSGVASLIHEFLGTKLNSKLQMAPVNIGYDPMNPLFAKGEAYSIPIDAEMVMILNVKANPPNVIHADDGDTPSAAGRL